MEINWIHCISAPVIGAVIGYFTNYIAVKMLFYPRHEVRLWGHRVPFTPGAIPKGKERLANAAGKVVAGSLLTREDLEAILLSEKIEGEIADAVTAQTQQKLRDLILSAADASEESYNEKKARLCTVLSQEVVRSIDVQTLIQEHGSEFLREKAQGTMLKLVLTEKKRQSITENIAESLQTLIDEQGEDYVNGILSEKLTHLEEQTGSELLEQLGADEEKLHQMVIDAYRRIISGNMDTMLSHIDIAGIVTDKINAMTVEEIEKLVLTMMKKELNTIVSLGALIGFVLGLINAFL